MNQNETNALAKVETTALAETSTAQASALAKAQVESRHIVARKFPRDIDTVRESLLKDCKRPAFAATARYHMPIGGGVDGWSIRFVEAVISHMGNIETEVTTVFEDAEKEIIQIRVTDYEKNISHATTATVAKVVERLKPKQGQVVISSRRNSQGHITHLVAASESEFRAKKGAEVSKHVRTNAERLIPAWLKEEAFEQLKSTFQNEEAQDPDAARRGLADAFGELGVKVADLKLYLGHDLDQASPADMAHLRAVYSTVGNGLYTWQECLAAKLGNDAPEDGKPDPHAALKNTLNDKLKGKTKGGRRKARAKKSQPEAAPDDHDPDEPPPGALASDREGEG